MLCYKGRLLALVLGVGLAGGLAQNVTLYVLCYINACKSVYIYIYIYIYTYIYTYTCTSLSMYIYIYIYREREMHIVMHIHII